MALEFNPPDWLIKEYMDRPSPVQQAAEGAQKTLGTYMQMKAMENTQQNEKMGNYVKAFEAGGPDFAAEYAKRVGLENPPALPARTATMVPPGGVAGQMAQPGGAPPPTTPFPQGQPQMAMPPAPQPTYSQGQQIGSMLQNPQAPPTMGPTAESPVLAHWNQTMGNGGGGPPAISSGTASAPSVQPPSIGLPDEALLNKGKWGKGQYDEGMKRAEANVKFAPKTPITKEDLIKKGTFDPAKDYVVEPPAGNEARDQRRQDQMAKAVTEYGKQIETNPIIKNLQLQNIGLHNVEEMGHLIAQGNTVASAAMGMKMARAMGEVGVITEQDVKRYVQSRKLTQAAADKLSGWLNGVPSNATLGEINEITQALKDSYDSKIQPIYNRYIDRFARAYKLTPEDAAYQLAFPYDKGTGAGAPTGGGLPQVGGTFEGGRVLKVTRVQKAPKP